LRERVEDFLGRRGDRTLAVATIGRDVASLRVEVAMEIAGAGDGR